ncbi:MAG: lipoyl(octanoyl) transferase LipB [Rickettsiales bacterium]|jgi:lipoyl(octanoyl) transferase|nr:lipoyl(octanoyl) transferase LipB [Rickettsiales bacterium]
MHPVEWKISEGLTDYEMALAAMESRVENILTGRAGELIWLVEHPALYTAGTSAKATDLLSQRFPVYAAGRGGEYTYHGPGQRVVYVMLNLKARGAMDVRRYVASLEAWIISALKQFGVEGFTREGRVGVWVSTPSPLEGEKKVAAIGIRIRKWVTFHGICINVNPDLSHYAGIVPCGIREFGVTSLEKLGVRASMADVDEVLRRKSSLVIS